MKKLLVVLLALLPSLWFVFRSSGTVPHLGHFSDDGVYVGTAASLADGRGFRVESLPGEPYQVRYPPLYPLFLMPGAGGGRSLAVLLFLTMLGLLAAIWHWRPEPALVLLAGWNAYAVLFANSALSEVFGTVWLVLCAALLERERVWQAALAASAAYLTRTALIAVPGGAILWLAWKRRWRDAALFGLIFAPVFVGWAWYVTAHTEPGVSGTRAFYSDYSKFFGDNFSLELAPTIIQTNLPHLVAGAAGLLFFNGSDDFLEINFARLLLFAAVSGLVRRARAEGVGPFEFMAVPYVCALAVWNYVPQERFLFPVLPLLAFGFVREIRFQSAMLRNNWATQRGAVVVFGAVLGAGLLWAAHRTAVSALVFAPSIPMRYIEVLPERERAFEWVRQNTPATANFLAAEDVALRRFTGRHGIGFHFPTRYFYTNDQAAISAYHSDIIPRMRAEGLGYLLIGPFDMELDLFPADREKILRHWLAMRELETVYESALYRVRRFRSER